MACESIKASEGRIANLEEEVKTLQEELSSAREKSSEVERLKKERAYLVARCRELEDAICREVECIREVSPEVVRKIKEDYLTLEEFQEEKFECAMDRHSRGFNECIHQMRELDPSFDTSRLREDLSEEEVDEERVNIDD